MDPVVRVAGHEDAGQEIDLREWGASVEPAEIAAAARDPNDERVAAPDPGPAHEYVGCVQVGMDLPLQAAVAAGARSRGATAPQDDALREVCERRASVEVPSVDLTAVREDVAAATAEETALRERVARLSGQVEARRELDADTGGAEAALEEAAAELAEAETERIAAEQRLRNARRRAREARDARETRRELADRAENLRRAARAHLAETWYDRFAAATAAVPGEANPGDSPKEYGGDPVTAALAVARGAEIRAPVVLAAGRFDRAETARDCLDAPVVLV